MLHAYTAGSVILSLSMGNGIGIAGSFFRKQALQDSQQSLASSPYKIWLCKVIQFKKCNILRLILQLPI